LQREPKWYQHYYFHLEDPYTNLHIFGPDSPETVRHGIFRERLREYLEDRELYIKMKREAAEAIPAIGGETAIYLLTTRALLSGLFWIAFL
jgi:GrpB-like predicted nucleotidyltransferase (UPF0157 family)